MRHELDHPLALRAPYLMLCIVLHGSSSRNYAGKAGLQKGF